MILIKHQTLIGELIMNVLSEWEKAQVYEREWHSSCANSYQEESKQITYAQRMGLNLENRNGRYPVIDFKGQKVIDIGGGPYSLLLKGINLIGTVVDPCDYPQWTKDRYKAAGIEFIQAKGEDYKDGQYDVGLIYNCLQHVENPKKVIQNMLKMCDIIYLHEWLDTPISDGHIHTIKEKDLNKWLGGQGMIGYERWSDTVTTPYYAGVFV